MLQMTLCLSLLPRTHGACELLVDIPSGCCDPPRASINPIVLVHCTQDTLNGCVPRPGC